MSKGCIHIEFLNLINTIFCSCQSVNYCKQSSSTGLGSISTAFSSLVCVPPREGTAGCLSSIQAGRFVLVQINNLKSNIIVNNGWQSSLLQGQGFQEGPGTMQIG